MVRYSCLSSYNDIAPYFCRACYPNLRNNHRVLTNHYIMGYVNKIVNLRPFAYYCIPECCTVYCSICTDFNIILYYNTSKMRDFYPLACLFYIPEPVCTYYTSRMYHYSVFYSYILTDDNPGVYHTIITYLRTFPQIYPWEQNCPFTQPATRTYHTEGTY